MKKLVFVQSNPIQYFAPLYRYLAERGVNVEVWYCSDAGVRNYADKEFGVNLKWNVPLLEGYKYRFYRNFSPKFLRSTFFRYLNLGMLRDMAKEKNALFVVPGWQYSIYVLFTLFGSILGKEVSLRFETPFNQMRFNLRGGWLRELFLKWYINLAKYLFYIGIQNKLFGEYFVNDSSRLIFSPYSVDNERFSKEYRESNERRQLIRDRLGISDDAVVVLYSGKFISKKRPLDLLSAYLTLFDANVWVIFMGEGELRGEMESFIEKNCLENVILTGFVNQDRVAEYYIAADIFVMCSGIGETWGLSINEAMNFDLPVVVYDMVGSASDLVQNGENGFIVPYGDVRLLSDKLSLLVKDSQFRRQAGLKSKEIISRYSYEQVYEGFIKVL